MPLFVLDVDSLPEHRAIGLRLSDEHGRHLGASQVRLDDHPAALWEGLFDARGYLRRFAGALRVDGKSEPATAEELLARLGVFLGQHVLGPAILGALAAGMGQRTLFVRLPVGNLLAAALARVPWELAWPSKNGAPEGGPLLRRNVVVRAAPAGMSPSAGPMVVPLGAEEALRVLLVYAEAPGSRPLGARLERERLLELFFGEVMPKRRVTVEVLSHGVTRERLRERVQSAGGFHVVHWSGHGRFDALELAGASPEGAARDVLSGAGLAELFGEAGGFIPRFVFLSACHSGAVAGDEASEKLMEWLRDPGRLLEPGEGGASPAIAAGAGYSGTALELVRAGVQQVVGMRHEVSDAFARDLAARFYRGLLGQQKLHAADAALAMARSELAQAAAGPSGYDPADFVTPLLVGAEPLRFEPAPKRSPQLDRARPQPQPLLRGGGLDPPKEFVGREEELSRLATALDGQEGPVAALIHGPAGIGKSALAAEAIHVWHGRFDAVLAFQGKSGPLALDDVYKQLHARLSVASPAYRARCEANELAAVFIEPGSIPEGQDREELLRENLLDVMLGTRVLLVLDHFDESLSSLPGEGGFSAADPAWDRLLSALASRLRGSGSRALVTSRRPASALRALDANEAPAAIDIELGPLPPAVAALFLETSEPLRALVFGGPASAPAGGSPEVDGHELASRVLEMSGGHPLLLKRLSDIARQGRAALAGELDRLSAMAPEARIGADGS